jgi:Tol biopolymer transport system component
MSTHSSYLPRPIPLLLALVIPLRVVLGAPQLVSVIDSSQSPPAGGSGDSYAPVMSPDGRYVVFSSTANNLVLNNTTNSSPALGSSKLNVFIRDRDNGTTTLASVSLYGTGGGNGDSVASEISTNSRFVLFESSASDLVSGDANGATDIFVRDLVTGTTLLVSVSTNGVSANGSSRDPVMTPDGRYVAFVSEATDLVPGDTNGIADVFLRDLQTGTTTLVSVGALPLYLHAAFGFLPPGSSEFPQITSDGRYVAFFSDATNLVADVTFRPGVQNVGEVYVRDLVGGTTYWASGAARSVVKSLLGTSDIISFNHAISADGSFVAYEASTNLPSYAAARGIIFRFNLGAGLTDLVHTNANVARPCYPYHDVRSLAMTPDGRFIAFVANTNGVVGTNTCILLWDAQLGASTLVSGNLSNAFSAGSTCDWPTIDPTGRYVAFLSNATNMVTNTIAGDYHLYVRDTQSGVTKLVDADTNAVGSSLDPDTVPALSADGRFVAFQCSDASLVANDRNHDNDIFVRDLVSAATEMISVRDPALPSLTPNGPSSSSAFSISANSRYIAFFSEADNLVPNDTNGCRDVFVRDLLAGTNILVSVATNGIACGDGPSTDAAMTADGRYVAFTSSADNLVPGDVNKVQDVFVRDLLAATTTLISIGADGVSPGNNHSYSPAISSDGRYILFRSKAGNLALGTFSGAENLFLRDQQSNTTYALTTDGVLAASMNPDGRFVVFGGQTSNVFLWDSQAAMKSYTNTTTSGVSNAAAVSADGNLLAFSVGCQLYAVDRLANTNWIIGPQSSSNRAVLRFSADGRFLAYVTTAAQVPTDTNGTNDIYLYDFQDGTNLLVSQSFNAVGAGNDASDSPDISADGRFIAYRSFASDIVPGDTNGLPDVFLYDRLAGATTLSSVNNSGVSTGNNRSRSPVFSGDAQTIVFQSWASDLVAQDFNHGCDVFAFSLSSSNRVAPLNVQIFFSGTLGQGPTLSWPAASGTTYRAQFKNNLNDPDWQDLYGDVGIVGDRGYFNDSASYPSQRFYRIVAF